VRAIQRIQEIKVKREANFIKKRSVRSYFAYMHAWMDGWMAYLSDAFDITAHVPRTCRRARTVVVFGILLRFNR
jgi:hypothetical protein